MEHMAPLLKTKQSCRGLYRRARASRTGRRGMLLWSVLFLLVLAPPLWSQEFFFTYLGATLGGGASKVQYSDWVDDERETFNETGFYYSGGPILNIFVRSFVGEFSMQYINDAIQGEGDVSVQHLLFTAIGKYAYRFTETVSLTAGAGLYIETGPSDNRYDGGGGGEVCIGAAVSLKQEWMLLFDINGRYGYFGKGEDATKLSYGLSVGALYRVGRL